MSMTNAKRNAIPMEERTTLTVHILIDGKEILSQALCNEEVAKGVVIGWTNIESKSIQALNETTFLATYAVGILAEEIGTGIEKIDNWLGKPVVTTCNEVTPAQLPHVLEYVQHTVGVKLVVFTVEWMICILIHYRVFRVVTIAMQPALICWGQQAQPFWTKYQVYHVFWALKGKRTLFSSNSGTMPFQMFGRILMSSW